MITFCYDMKQKRFGCVLLQAAYGATIDNFELQKTLDSWLLGPTDDLKLYNVKDQEELDRVIKLTQETNAK